MACLRLARRRNLRLVLVADPGLPSEKARDLAPGLPEDLRRRTARGIRWQADADGALVADEQVDVSLPALGSRRLRRRVRQAVAGVVRQQAAKDEEPLARRRPSGTQGGRGRAWVGFVDALDAQDL
ncbi:hypothetical protein ACWGI8_36210 [Streptomyces sp. NPDC054841]